MTNSKNNHVLTFNDFSRITEVQDNSLNVILETQNEYPDFINPAH